jgi:hypothetical protein
MIIIIPGMNALPSSDWVPMLNLSQLSAGLSTPSTVLVARKAPFRRRCSHIAGSNLKSFSQVRTISARRLPSLSAGRYEGPSSNSLPSCWRVRRGQILPSNHGRSPFSTQGADVRRGFDMARSAPAIRLAPPPFSDFNRVPHEMRPAQLAPPSNQPIVVFPPVRNHDPHECSLQRASGRCCTPCECHVARDCPRCHRCPQPHLTLCFILAIRVALHEIRSVCIHDRHMLPTLMYIVHALIPHLASLPSERDHLLRRDRQAIWVVQGRLDLPYT